MKIKFISFLLLLFNIVIFTNVVKADELEKVYYNNIILDNKLYNLETGVLEDNDNYISIQRFTINNLNLQVDNMFYHHVLMWDNQNRYLGYFNNSLFTDVKLNTYRGDIINEYNFNLLPNTRIVAFVGAKELEINFTAPSENNGLAYPLTTYNDILNNSNIDYDHFYTVTNTTGIYINGDMVDNLIRFNDTLGLIWFFPDSTSPMLTLRDNNTMSVNSIYYNATVRITFTRIGYTNNISYLSIETVRPYQEKMPKPPATNIIDRINNYLDRLGINNTFTKITISIVVIGAVLFLLGVLGANSIIIIIVGLVLYLIFTLLGWIPFWILLIIMIIIFVLLIFNNNKGGTVDD